MMCILLQSGSFRTAYLVLSKCCRAFERLSWLCAGRSSNIDAAISTGSIFGIYDPNDACTIEDMDDPAKMVENCVLNVCQPGAGVHCRLYAPAMASRLVLLCRLRGSDLLEAKKVRKAGASSLHAPANPISCNTPVPAESWSPQACQPADRAFSEVWHVFTRQAPRCWAPGTVCTPAARCSC